MQSFQLVEDTHSVQRKRKGNAKNHLDYTIASWLLSL
jgi:hypothetical protein